MRRSAYFCSRLHSVRATVNKVTVVKTDTTWCLAEWKQDTPVERILPYQARRWSRHRPLARPANNSKDGPLKSRGGTRTRDSPLVDDSSSSSGVRVGRGAHTRWYIWYIYIYTWWSLAQRYRTQWSVARSSGYKRERDRARVTGTEGKEGSGQRWA